MMKIYGGTEGGDAIELRDLTLLVDVADLTLVIDFLKSCLEEIDSPDWEHEHLCDYSSDQDYSGPDIEVWKAKNYE